MQKQSTIVESHSVPSLRLAIPMNYPNGSIQVVRAQLDLDSYFYDDLQNTIHQHLSRGGLHSVTDYLNAWVGSLCCSRIYYFVERNSKMFRNPKIISVAYKCRGW